MYINYYYLINSDENSNNSVDAAAEIITIMDKRSMVYCKNLVA